MVEINVKHINLRELISELNGEEKTKLLLLLMKEDGFDYKNVHTPPEQICFENDKYNGFFYFVIQKIIKQNEQELFLQLYEEDQFRDNLNDLQKVLDKFTFYIQNKEKFSELMNNYKIKKGGLDNDERIAMMKELLATLAKN